MLKDDASMCHAHLESVNLALQILDDNLTDDTAILSVQHVKFEQHGPAFEGNNKTIKNGRRVILEAKCKMVRLVALQAMGWYKGLNGHIVRV